MSKNDPDSVLGREPDLDSNPIVDGASVADSGGVSGSDLAPNPHRASDPKSDRPRTKHRAVVRLSRVDRLRLEAGEIEDPYQAVGKPEPSSQTDSNASQPRDKTEKGRDAWLRQNVPPHW